LASTEARHPRSQRLLDPLPRRLDLGEPGQVGDHLDGDPATPLDLPADRGHGSRVSSVDRDLRTLLRESPRDLGADAAGAAGDPHHLAGE
jgi:hypothetical protein